MMENMKLQEMIAEREENQEKIKKKIKSLNSKPITPIANQEPASDDAVQVDHINFEEFEDDEDIVIEEK